MRYNSQDIMIIALILINATLVYGTKLNNNTYKIKYLM